MLPDDQKNPQNHGLTIWKGVFFLCHNYQIVIPICTLNQFQITMFYINGCIYHCVIVICNFGNNPIELNSLKLVYRYHITAKLFKTYACFSGKLSEIERTF